MKRRTFLKTTVVAVGCVSMATGTSKQSPKPKASPRWKWEVGPWEVDQWENPHRQWHACVDGLADACEPKSFPRIAGFMNGTTFCNINPRLLHIQTVAVERKSCELSRVTVHLVQSFCNRLEHIVIDGVKVWRPRMGQVDFYELLPGGHVVVSQQTEGLSLT